MIDVTGSIVLFYAPTELLLIRMHRFLNWAILLLILSGCRSAPTQTRSLMRQTTPIFTARPADTDAGLIEQVAHSEDVDTIEPRADLISAVEPESVRIDEPGP